jgi:predicted DNA-binding transcriptional regulator AlpA
MQSTSPRPTPTTPRGKYSRAPYHPDGIARLYHTREAFGFSRSTAERERRAGRLPEPIKVSSQIKGWTPDQVREWREGRVAASRTNKNAPAHEGQGR